MTLMRLGSLFFLSVLMLIQGSASIWITFAFYTNQEYIAKNECEKKLIIENTCQGQCVLKKKLHDEQERKQEGTELEIKPILLFVHQTEVLHEHLQLFVQSDLDYAPYTDSLCPLHHSMSVFRPPIKNFLYKA